MGTFILIILGSGVNAGVTLKRSYAQGAGWIVITAGWAFAVLSGIFVSLLFGSPDAHLSPAFTLAFAISQHDFSKLASFIVAQVAGAFSGATLVWLFYFHHWKQTDDPAAKRGIFCTAIAIRSYGWNLFSEFVATFVLVLVAGAMGSKLVLSSGAANGIGPFLVSCLIWGIGMSLGGTTGYALNPARDFGPRLAHAILPFAGKGSSD